MPRDAAFVIVHSTDQYCEKVCSPLNLPFHRLNHTTVHARTETRRSGIVTWRHVGRGLTGSRSRLCSQSCFQWSHLASRRSPSPLPCLP
ncbi:hypothetical protein QLX08_004519 [Tetragonisca angustula]|uniref:Uncharacterized protein n=1 Tax=Tetragonisca angustula TaxID=166442 RepID=A0AAW1A449_9HYME